MKLGKISSLGRGQKWVGFLVLSLLAFGLLVACTRPFSGQVPKVSGEVIQAPAETVEGFGIVRAGPGNARDSARLVVEFSQPLISTQDFDQLLHIEGGPATERSGWYLDRDGKTLVYPHVKAAHEYTLTVRPGLLAADGSTLGREVKRTIFTGQLPPVLGFASQGSVLPARDSRGLPVVSVNVPEVDVEFLRVPEAKLSDFFANYPHAGRRSAWELTHKHDTLPMSQLTEPVYVSRFVLDGKENERTLTYLPIQRIAELQKPGLYFAVMKQSGTFEDEFDTAFFTVSDIGLHTRAYKEQLFVHTAALATGEPLRQIELRIVDDKGQTLLQGRTDSNGNALLNYRLDTKHVLIAARGTDVSFLPFNQPALDLSEFAVAGRQNAWFDVFTWSGRDLYRPGETVRVSALLRDNDGKPVPAQPLFVRLKQPDGKPYRETRLQPDEQGYVYFEQVIAEQAPTGYWQVEFRTDPASREAIQGMRLRIEEFLPERMKLDLDSQHAVLTPGQPFTLQAQAAYLYGAPASGNRLTARLALSVEQHPLDAMPGWFFGDPTISLPRQAEEIIDTALAADGTLQHVIALPEEAIHATPVSALVSASVHESGGRPVNRTLKRVVWPAPALVAVRPLFDDKDGANANSQAHFELHRVDAEGNAQPAHGLQIKLIREQRDYHWNWDNQRWNYDFTRTFVEVSNQTLDSQTTAVRFSFPVEWGDYRVDIFDPATGLTMRYPFTAGWSWDDGNRGLDARPDKIKVALNQTSYRSGDTLKVTLTPPHPGRGLIMVESDHLLYVHDVEVKPGSTFNIPVTDAWNRHDVYITALVFRGGSVPSKITPARAVGVAHVPMDRSDRQIEVTVQTPQHMRPEQPIEVVVDAPQLAGNESAYVVVSAVDVGITNITRFPVPDPAAHFFAKRRLGIDAYDIYGRVIESFQGGRGRLKFGGDMASEPLPQARRPTARVQTVDLFSGPVKLDAQGQATISLDVPDFNGTLRVSAVVYAGEHYGKVDTETVVRAPVVAEASLPRVLAPDDHSTLTLDVQNFTGQAGEFSVQISGEGPLMVNDGQRRIQLEDGAKTTLNFPIIAQMGHSVAQARVQIDGLGINVDRRYELPIRVAWPQVVYSQIHVLDPLEPVTLERKDAQGLIADSVNARMLVSALPPIPFASALHGALNYPYGCAEQTTSKGYAALLLDEATSILLGADGLDAETRRIRMEGAFARLSSMQTSNGHFSMWGDDSYINPALTPYVVEFLLDAKQAGFAVPETLLQKALDRLNEDLLSNRYPAYNDYNNPRDSVKFAYQAYSGYVLARINRAPLGTLRTLYDNQLPRSATYSALSWVHLGLALSLQGDQRRGQAAMATGFTQSSTLHQGGYVYLGNYGSPLRDQALMIALVHEQQLATPEYDAQTLRLGRDLDARRKRNNGQLWLSTQEQVALARLGKVLALDQSNKISGELFVGNESHDAIQDRTMYAQRFDFAALVQGVRFVPQGQTPFYASVDIAGIPNQAPEPDLRSIDIERYWFTPDGSPWQAQPLKEGQALIVRLRLRAHQDMPDALITDLLPAGLEIENFNLTGSEQWGNVRIDGKSVTGFNHRLRYQEFRDDRYVAALNLEGNQTTYVFYLVRAVTPGTYTVPAPLAEDMYRPELRGVGKANPSTITVVPP